MADWNPSKDPYYAELFQDNQTKFLDDWMKTDTLVRKREQQDQVNEANQIKLEQAKQAREQEQQLRDAISQDTSGDYRKAARKVFEERGDIDSLLKLDKEATDAEEKERIRNQREREFLMNLPPEVAMREWNNGPLGKRYGEVSDPYVIFGKGKKQGSLSTGIYHEDPITGEVVVDRNPMREPRGEGDGDGGSKVNNSWMINPDTGDAIPVNPRDSNQQIKFSQSGYIPANPTIIAQIKEQKALEQRKMSKESKDSSPSGVGAWMNDILGTMVDANKPKSPYEQQGTKPNVVKIRKKQGVPVGIGQ